MTDISKTSNNQAEEKLLAEFDYDQLITEDDTPVPSIAAEKQQRLLIDSLYSSFKKQKFLAACNVGIFYAFEEPPLVPNLFVSFGVLVPDNWWEKANRSYFLWNFGKPPEVVVDIVCDEVEDELTKKQSLYAAIGTDYYIVYDPAQQLGKKTLYVYELSAGTYVEKTTNWLDKVQLGVTLWQGEFERVNEIWLRWCDIEGALYLTSSEYALEVEQKTPQYHKQILEAEQKTQEYRHNIQILEEKLRSMGIDPDTVG